MPILRDIYNFLRFPIMLMLCLALSASTPTSREYQIKAAILFNFTQFVVWPDEAFSSPKTPMVMGIIGEDPFGSYLDKLVSDEIVMGHSISVERFHNVDEIKTCHILFINASENVRPHQVIDQLKGKSVLTVSDEKNFINQGGMIRFYTENNKMHFQINPEAARAANLTISSKLLRLAEIVIPNKK